MSQSSYILALDKRSGSTDSASVALQVLTIYGRYALQVGQVSNIYTEKYKGIWLSMSTLTKALSGNYVNFGVFELYGDPALKACSHLCLSVHEPSEQSSVEAQASLCTAFSHCSLLGSLIEFAQDGSIWTWYTTAVPWSAARTQVT